MQEINQNLLIFLNSFMENKIVEKLAVIFADAPIFFLPLFLVTMWLYYTYKEKNIEKKQNLLFIFYSAVIWIIISYIIKAFVSVDRPETVLEWVWKLVLDHIPDASFPSDHATVSIAFLVSLFLAKHNKTALFFLIPAILMNISRIVVWVHWPLDIIVWIIVWTISAFISFKVLIKCKLINKLNLFIIKIMWYIKL